MTDDVNGDDDGGMFESLAATIINNVQVMAQRLHVFRVKTQRLHVFRVTAQRLHIFHVTAQRLHVFFCDDTTTARISFVMAADFVWLSS